MLSGTSKKRRYFPIHTIVEHLPDSIIPKVLAFHALTGCDTTSYMANHSKRSAWKVFKENHELLKDIGVGDLTDEITSSAEKFVCRLYNVTQTDSVDQARYILFSKTGKPESLCPTKDALVLHLNRVHYETMVWRHADCAVPTLPNPVDMG